MASFGAFCFPGTGHINPMTALARRLEKRGHTVVIFGIADVEAKVRAAGIDFYRIGTEDYPPGTLQRLDRRLGELKGLPAFRFTVDRVKNSARMVLRDGPAAVRSAGVDALLIDEAELAGSIAEHLGMRFISIAFFPPLIQDDRIPPFLFGWNGKQHRLARLRNRLGIHLLGRVAAPVLAVVNERRLEWNLAPLLHSADSLSSLAQITQLPKSLEFFDHGHPHLHYTGPFLDNHPRSAIDFPWQQLDGRPLVYASLGTLQNGSETVFRAIAQACAPLHLQLAISLGGGLDPSRLANLPGNPIVVRFAPQLDVLKRAAAVITHAGLNTVLEALNEGVPLVALPQGNDQPGVAARVAAAGAGITLAKRRLNFKHRLRTAVRAVLEQPCYRSCARRLQTELQQIDGLDRAADIIEQTLDLGPMPSLVR